MKTRRNRFLLHTIITVGSVYVAVSLLSVGFAPAASLPDAPTPPPVVKLLEAGKDPRRVLRYVPEVGHKRTTVMIMKVITEMSRAGQKLQSVNAPEMQFTIDVN